MHLVFILGDLIFIQCYLTKNFGELYMYYAMHSQSLYISFPVAFTQSLRGF